MNKNTPKVRFKGFKEVWNSEKLENIAEFSKGSGYTKNDLVDSGTPIILYGRLYTKYENIISEVGTFVEQKNNSVVSEGNEVIVPSSGESPEDIARASFVKTSGIILGGDLNIIKANPSISPSFLSLTISNGNSQKELAKKAQGKSIVHLHNSDLKEVNLSYPSLEEQHKIDELYEKIDNVLILQKKIIEQYLQYKKAMLLRMYPQKDQNIPELRFNEFNGNWDERKLGDLVSIKSGWSPSNFIECDKLDGIPFIKVDDLNASTREQEISKIYVENNNRFTLIPKGSIIFPKRGAAILTNKIRMLKENSYMDTNMMGLIPKEIEVDYLYTFIEKTGLYKIADTSTIPQINNKHIEPYTIFVPSKEEQQKIGTFFKKLDETIDFHRKKLVDYQQLKKALLQRMFM